MNKYDAIRKKLYNHYKQSIAIRLSNSDSVRYDLGDMAKHIDIAIFLNKRRHIAVIWNVVARRAEGWNHTNVSYSENLANIVIPERHIFPDYKTFCVEKDRFFEKILIMDLDTLNAALFELYDLLEYDENDEKYPPELKHKETQSNHKKREKITTSRWNREQIFRQQVLAAYNYQCAICRCNEQLILEAAHIVAVADGGTDELDNGICLCANHHLMLDHNLIQIDYKNNTLTFIADSVRSMPWHKEFIHTYHGKTEKRQRMNPENYH